MKADLSNALFNLEKAKYSLNKSEKKDLQDRRLKELTDQFEAFFIKKILDISMPKNNALFPKDPGEKIYRSMYNDAVANRLSGNFGFSQLLYNFLKENKS